MPWAVRRMEWAKLLIDAFERGARRFIIGLGGTATTDGGFGMLKALYVHAGPAAFFDTYLLACAMNVVGRWPVMSAIRFMGRKELQLFLPHKRELRPPKWCTSMRVCNAWHSMPPEGWGTIVRCYLVQEQQADWDMPFCSTSARRCSREQIYCSMRLTSTPA